jgi:hypothetical protein
MELLLCFGKKDFSLLTFLINRLYWKKMKKFLLLISIRNKYKYKI